MEKNHKNTDCYFFYYSTCTKGDSCAYRHEASALGCETVCSYWQQGSCLNQHCNFRHMDIKKNRKVIPCYWEKFPTGCKKPHCPFLHRLNRSGVPNPIESVKAGSTPAKPVNQEWSNRQDAKFDGNSTESEQGRGSSEAGSFIGSPVVDPLIVNFEEESDSESAPSPSKNPRNRISSCKTYEEIRLEEIQAESAAFYSYASSEDYQNPSSSPAAGGGKIKNPTSARSQRLASGASIYGREKEKNDSNELNFEVLSLAEIRRRRNEKKPVPMKEEEQEEVLLKDAVKALDELKSDVEVTETTTTITVTRKKRSFHDAQIADSENSAKKARMQTVVGKAPPIKLRRRRITSISKEEDKAAEARKEEEERKAKERLAKASKDDVDSSSSARRQSVEVRVCDSSTDDNQSTESSEEKDKKDKSIAESLDDSLDKPLAVCDSAVKLDDKGRLPSIDAEDDILKDIDALLTDEPVS